MEGSHEIWDEDVAFLFYYTTEFMC